MSLHNWINAEYLAEEKIKKFQITFSNNQPFPHLELPHFLKQEKIIILLQALGEQEFSPHNSDLFQFSQTYDLLHSDDPVLKEFAAFLSSPEMIQFMQKITKIKLSGKIDLFGSIYQDTDYLLPHDDQVPGRKIAFMVYLNDLEEDDGGALALYESKNKTPTKVVKKFIPKAGTLVFFEVSELSIHRVEEVLTDTQRITLSGWFYG
ncbi:MAG: 2OG-Fe(II) oxygenase family protein [Nanoarchaeota archaeon]